MKSKELKRIPYNVWAYSQLSVAKYYWWIKIEWEHYEFDREVMKEMLKDEKEQREKWVTEDSDWWLNLSKSYFPDLILYK